MDRSTFLKSLRRNRLLPRKRLAELARQFPGDDPPQTLARALVARGLLTPFQARKVLAGKAHCLHLAHYRLLEPIGRGGSGRVFKALDTLRQCLVALKILPRDVRDREVQAALRLDHPHIVTVYDACFYRSIHFLVLEYLDGTNLDELVKQKGPLPVPLACNLIRQAAEALQYAHQRGLTHRDIKPANLLITSASTVGGLVSHDNGPMASANGSAELWVKVLDFGLSRVPYTDTADVLADQAAGLEGSPDYVSPEHVQGMQRVDIRSDLYSLGCTLYFALTGRVPFPGSLVMEKLTKHLLLEPEPVEKLRPDVPPVVAGLVRRLMAKDPRERFATPAPLVRALAPWCDPTRQPEESEIAEALEPEPDEVEHEPGGGHSAPTSDGLDELMAAWRGKRVEVDPSLRANWRRWTDLVRRAYRGYRLRNRMAPLDYRDLVNQVVEGCRSQAGAAEAEEWRLFWRLGELARPWTNLEATERAPREVLAALVGRCEQVERLFGLRRRLSVEWLRLLVPIGLVTAVVAGWAINRWYFPIGTVILEEILSFRDRVLGLVNKETWLLGAGGLVFVLAYLLARSTRH